MRRSPAWRVGVGALLLAPACTLDPGDREGQETTYRDSAGVSVVSNAGSGWDGIRAWRLETDLQVGARDGDLAFGQIRWVGPGHEGRLLILDGQSKQVYSFEPDGRLHARFGGEGHGPGEFRQPATVAALADGRLAVTETMPPAIHWLSADGGYLSSFQLPMGRSEGGTRTAGAFAVWQVTSYGVPFAQVMLFAAPAEGRTEMPTHVLRFGSASLDGAPPDTLLSWSWEPGLGDEEIRVFEPDRTWAPRDDGSLVYSPGRPYEIRELNPGGSLVRVLRRALPPVPTTEAHRSAALEALRASMSDGGASEAMIDRMLQRVVFEKELPQVWRVWVSEPDGHVWAGVYEPERPPGGQSRAGEPAINAWDVFAPDGRFLGRLAAPEGFRLTAVTQWAAFGVWTDELDVPYARRYRIMRP